MDRIQTCTILRINGTHISKEEDPVASEAELAVFVNNRLEAVLLCSPGDTRALVAGYLYAKGLISDCNQIQTLNIQEADFRLSAFAELDSASDPQKQKSASEAPMLFFHDINTLANQVLAGSENFRSTGAFHICAICKGAEILTCCEDISRHCALDKALGTALLRGISFEGTCVITSGRVPTDWLNKVHTAGIRAVLSRSAPTAAAIEFAKMHNMILCGFVRGQRCNLYSGTLIEAEQKIISPKASMLP